MHPPEPIALTGLDGGNPLGFIAAIGLLRVLVEARPVDGVRPRLRWRLAGTWRPVIDAGMDRDAVIDAVLAHARGALADPALTWGYDDDGHLVEEEEIKVRDLKPLPTALRRLQDSAAARACGLAVGPTRRRSVDLVGAFGNELATANDGRVKPHALHFTAGQQRLLTMVRDIAQGIQRVDVEEALFGPWKNASALPNLSWNAGASRLYALRAGNPAKDKRGGVPAADWLGFSAWPLLPVAAVGSRLHTALFRGGWKDGSLYWPLWAVPATAFTVRALITAYPERLSPAQRTARGIDAVMRAGILRSDQGGYGSFSPAEVL